MRWFRWILGTACRVGTDGCTRFVGCEESDRCVGFDGYGAPCAALGLMGTRGFSDARGPIDAWVSMDTGHDTRREVQRMH